jgi:hypothetical protein
MEEGKGPEPIHGFNIGIDHRYEGTEIHHDLKDLTHDWKHDLSKEDLHKILHEAKHSSNGKYNLPERDATVVYNRHDDSYTIRKRGDY